MSRPLVHIYSMDTQESIIREMNDEEFAQHQIMQEKDAMYLQEQEARSVAKQALLEKLGITEEEAKLLLS